jgi:hypothetical protein
MRCRPLPDAVVAVLNGGPFEGETIAVPYPGLAFKIVRPAELRLKPGAEDGPLEILLGEYRRASPIRKNGRASFVFSGWSK